MVLKQFRPTLSDLYKTWIPVDTRQRKAIVTNKHFYSYFGDTNSVNR